MIRYNYILLLLTAFLLSCERDISTEQADVFIKFYGNYLLDEAGDVEVLANGGYAICGTESTSSGGRMVLIVTDKFGNMQSGFPKYYTEDGLETGGNSLIALQDGSGGFFLSGFIERPVAGTQTVQKDIFIVRCNASGEETWQKSYGSLEDEQILHAVEMIKPGYMLAGYQVKDGKSDILVMGVSEEGDSIKLGLNYNNPYAENATASYLRNTGDMYLCVCTFDKVNGEGTGIQILTFDDELSPLATSLSGEFDEYGMCITEESNGHFLVLGNRVKEGSSGKILVYGIEIDGLNITNSTLLASISEENTDLWGRRIVQASNGIWTIAGTMTTDGNSQVLMQFLSSGYAGAEKVSFGASGDQAGMDIELSADGGFVVLGANSYGKKGTISLMKTSVTGDL